MSSYIERWCPKHGEWQEDVDCPSECPDCEKEGIAPSQIAAKEHAELAALRAEIARLREALEHISKWEPKDYEEGAEYWEWWNYDDVYRYGVDSAYSAAAKYAKAALAVPKDKEES